MNKVNNYSYNLYNQFQSPAKNTFIAKDTKQQIVFKGNQVSPELAKKAKPMLTNTIKNICSSNFMQNLIEKVKYNHIVDKKTGEKIYPRFNVLQNLNMMGLAVFLDIVYITRTMQSKKIEEDRKRTLAINQAITMVFSFVSASTLDKLLDSSEEKIKNKFKELNKEKFDAKKIDNLKNGIGILKKALLIAIIYRYIAPVVATPLADKLTKHMNKHGWFEKRKDKKISTVPNSD